MSVSKRLRRIRCESKRSSPRVAPPSCVKKLGNGWPGPPSTEYAKNQKLRNQTERPLLIFEAAAVGARGYRNAVIWIAGAHRNDRRRFVTHADEKSACVSGSGSGVRGVHQLSAPALHLPRPRATG